MIKNLAERQKLSKHFVFARSFSDALAKMDISPSPQVVTRAFNAHSNTTKLKPHTVRKWLLGITQPRSEILLVLAEWLDIEPQALLRDRQASEASKGSTDFEFEFIDQEVIRKYLAMTEKQKATVRTVIDAIDRSGK